MHHRHLLSRAAAILLCIILSACSGTPAPKGVKVGKPYEVDGKTYYPSYDSSYDRTGEASWYGPGFHGKYTANGEVFDQNDLTAAHPTLPMPSIVRVTSLQTGKSAIIRINDRGPFKSNRIIDLSKKSAETLGIRSTSPVRVQFLKRESEAYLASLKDGHPLTMAELNELPTSAEIVESTVASSKDGEAVTSAAPVTTVSSNDIAAKPAPAVNHSLRTPGKPVQLIREANAEETAPESPEAGDTVAPSAPVAQADIAPAKLQQAPTPIRDIPVKFANPQFRGPADADTSGGVLDAKVIKGAPQTESGQFVILAGSFIARENAQKIYDNLNGAAPVSIDQVDAQGKSWWRVHVGPFDSREEAESVLEKVRASGSPSARISRL